MDPRWRKIGIALGWILFTGLCLWTALQVDRRRNTVEGDIERLYGEQRSGQVVQARGVVVREFADDLRGSRHQRFLVRLDSGHTVLISHNIDLAPRVDNLRRGDEITFRGEYEWNEKGGVVHWTHRDPNGDRPGGWLQHEGRTYR